MLHYSLSNSTIASNLLRQHLIFILYSTRCLSDIYFIPRWFFLLSFFLDQKSKWNHYFLWLTKSEYFFWWYHSLNKVWFMSVSNLFFCLKFSCSMWRGKGLLIFVVHLAIISYTDTCFGLYFLSHLCNSLRGILTLFPILIIPNCLEAISLSIFDKLML